MVIYLLRHAETDMNKNNLMQGRKNPILNKKGTMDALKVRDKLRTVPVDVCFSSPLNRSFQTAFLVVGDRCLINKDERLIERCLGDFEGKNKDLIDKKYNLKSFDNYHDNIDSHGVEKIQDVYKRAYSFLDDIKEQYKDKIVLIVSHSAVIKALHNILHDKVDNPDDLSIGNCYLEVVEVK